VIALSDVLLNTVTSSATESRRRDDCVLGGLLDVILGGVTVTEEVELSRDQCLVEKCSTPASSRVALIALNRATVDDGVNV